VADAAQTAARAGVGTLVLTHCVPAPLPSQVDEWISMAAEHFDGEVLLPADLDRVPVG
jgi:ribonuclease Z